MCKKKQLNYENTKFNTVKIEYLGNHVDM